MTRHTDPTDELLCSISKEPSSSYVDITDTNLSCFYTGRTEFSKSKFDRCSVLLRYEALAAVTVRVVVSRFWTQIAW